MNKSNGEKIPESFISKDKNSVMGNELAEAGNMDKIRDIFFGSQAKDCEKRFATMEKHLVEDAGDLKEELLRRIDVLEIYAKQGMKDINLRIKKGVK